MRSRACRWCDVLFVTPPYLRFLVLSNQECETRAAKLSMDRLIAEFLYGGDPQPGGAPGEGP